MKLDPRRLHPARQPWPVAVLLCALYATLAAALAGVNVVVTPSVPVGIYFTIRDRPPRVGDLVKVCLARATARWGRTHRILGGGLCPGWSSSVTKPVAAAAGDVVTVTRRGLHINGRAVPASAIATAEPNGDPLPHAAFGARRLPASTFWLHSSYNPRSWDSRYFGPVRLSQVRGRQIPLLTFD